MSTTAITRRAHVAIYQEIIETVNNALKRLCELRIDWRDLAESLADEPDHGGSLAQSGKLLPCLELPQNTDTTKGRLEWVLCHDHNIYCLLKDLIYIVGEVYPTSKSDGLKDMLQSCERAIERLKIDLKVCGSIPNLQDRSLLCSIDLIPGVRQPKEGVNFHGRENEAKNVVIRVFDEILATMETLDEKCKMWCRLSGE